MAKEIENEYFSLIDQIIIACDDKLSIVYNNYHERFYEKIMKKLHKLINMQTIRTKAGSKLDKCFQKNQPNLVAETRTFNRLLKIGEEFEFDPANKERNLYYKGVGVFNILQAFHEYRLQHQTIGFPRQSVNQVLLEAKENQLVSIELLVVCSDPAL
jgi:hypothetical protein